VDRRALLAPDEVDAREDVAPLVGAADLELAALVAVQVVVVVGLQEHVAELGVGDAVLAAHRAFTLSRATIWFT
jgi:hypothetical protein